MLKAAAPYVVSVGPLVAACNADYFMNATAMACMACPDGSTTNGTTGQTSCSESMHANFHEVAATAAQY
jgi:hypothetical protein